MKVMEVAPFSFYFKSTNKKEPSYKKLKEFLVDNGWLNENDNKVAPLSSFHSEENGICHVVLAEDQLTEEFIKITNKLFSTLISNNEIKWVKVDLQPTTEDIIYNNIDKYAKHQTIPIIDMKKGDSMVVFMRP